MDTKARLRELMEERGWSEYRLAQESNLALSTVANIFNRDTVPSIGTLQALCSGFGITLSQFFAGNGPASLTEEQTKLLTAWNELSDEKRAALLQLMRAMKPE